MQILNIAGYKFVSLTELPALRSQWLLACKNRMLKGTILLSEEGINLSLAGLPENIESFQAILSQDSRFHEMNYRRSYSTTLPFDRLKVKIKKEIITLRCPTVKPAISSAPRLLPHEFKQWLDENRDITVLDTRNNYEVSLGTFKNAVNLHLDDFSEFPRAAQKISRDKPVVMFCTGGIRCEKAAVYLLNEGFSEVYQLEGGILNYFSEIGGTHYEGDCFVFDQRVALNPHLQPKRNEE